MALDSKTLGRWVPVYRREDGVAMYPVEVFWKTEPFWLGRSEVDHHEVMSMARHIAGTTKMRVRVEVRRDRWQVLCEHYPTNWKGSE